MTITSYPGVYMEELPGGARPIDAAGTSTAAFFGMADRGPIGEVRKIFGFGEYEKIYGGFRSDGEYLGHAVYQFFNNGGRECYVGRVSNNYKIASVTIRGRGATKKAALKISATSPGVWGNSLVAAVSSASDKPNVFRLEIQDETGPNVFKPLEDFENLSMDPDSPTYVASVVNTRSQYVRVKIEDGLTTEATTGYAQSGIIPGADDVADFISATQRKLKINVNGDGWRVVVLDMTGKDPKKLAQVREVLEGAIRALTPLHTSVAAGAYNVTVQLSTPVAAKPDERKLKILSGLGGVDSAIQIAPPDVLEESIVGALSLSASKGEIEVFGHAAMRPADSAAGDPYRLGDDTVDADRVAAFEPGDDGSTAQPTDYVKAFDWLDRIADVSLIAVPGHGATYIADSGMSYCRNRPLSDCFFIADMPSEYDSLDWAKRYVQDINVPNSYGAVYFPWIRVPDPTGRSPLPVAVPPSGFVAGLYAQTDARRGVWKAPAGLEVQVAGAVGTTAELTDVEHGNLNKEDKSVAVIRKFQGSGLVLWGARTLSTDKEYRYIPVRRTAIMLRKSIYAGIQWAVFEPNDERLWSALRLNIGSFMNGLFRAGAFQGGKASDAYSVKCGLGDTMTQDDIDRGEVIVLVGFAPLKPAEFVIVRIQQKVGQAA